MLLDSAKGALHAWHTSAYWHAAQLAIELGLLHPRKQGVRQRVPRFAHACQLHCGSGVVASKGAFHRQPVSGASSNHSCHKSEAARLRLRPTFLVNKAPVHACRYLLHTWQQMVQESPSEGARTARSGPRCQRPGCP